MLRLITLFCTLSLIFAVAVDAHIDTQFARHHAPAVYRMIKKRSPALATGQGINNAAGPDLVDSGAQNKGVANAAPPPADSSATAAATNSLTVAPQPNPNPNPNPILLTTTPTTTSQPTLTATTTTTSAGLVGGILNGPAGANLSVVSTSTSSSSSSTSSSTSSTSSTPTSTTPTTSATPLTTATASTPTPAPDSVTSVPSLPPVTITSSAPSSATSAASTSSGSVTKLQRNTIIILIAIGGSIGLAALIWTIIRKWKFRPSSSFEDRMQPIDWQPTTGSVHDRDITEKLTRNGSTRSHGSFTSGNNHDHLTADLPPHDFTPGPAHLAPVGGYADLQRGPSPQPDIHREPSFRGPNPYQYEIPNPGQGAYYNTNGYQGRFDHRGY